MKKSPLSTPGGRPDNSYGGFGPRRGYGSNQSRNDNNFHRFAGSNASPNNRFDGGMIPLDCSSPVFYHNKGNRQQQYDNRYQRFSNTAFSGNYNNRNIYQNSPYTSYSPYQQKNQRQNQFQRSPFQKRNQNQNHFQKKNDKAWHRRIPIAEFVDLKSMYDNPWEDLETEITDIKCNEAKEVDSSVEIISEESQVVDSSAESTPDEGTINISSSLDEVKEGSSVELELDKIRFDQNSKTDESLSVTS